MKIFEREIERGTVKIDVPAPPKLPKSVNKTTIVVVETEKADEFETKVNIYLTQSYNLMQIDMSTNKYKAVLIKNIMCRID